MMLDVEAIIIVGLGAYRLAYLLVYEQGPFGLVARLRDALGATTDNCRVQGANGRITNALCCLNCTGIYTTLIVAGLWLAFPPAALLLAAAGLVTLLWTLT